jgi:predicted nucleic acid-binding protein
MHYRKIYLDTSVISHLKAEDTPDKMRDTLKFWEDIRQKKYEVFVSDVTFEELDKCPEPKRTVLADFLNEIDFVEVEESEETIKLAKDYLKFGVLPPKSFDDCRHMAIATYYYCDIIVSWNFKHFVNLRTITKVQAVNKLLGYDEVMILPPSMILEGDDEEW